MSVMSQVIAAINVKFCGVGTHCPTFVYTMILPVELLAREPMLKVKMLPFCE